MTSSQRRGELVGMQLYNTGASFREMDVPYTSFRPGFPLCSCIGHTLPSFGPKCLSLYPAVTVLQQGAASTRHSLPSKRGRLPWSASTPKSQSLALAYGRNHSAISWLPLSSFESVLFCVYIYLYIVICSARMISNY